MKSLISQLSADYPSLRFETADQFRWSAKQQTVFIDSHIPRAEMFLLHELSHAILGHDRYERDIELIKCERDAWEYATSTLSNRYDTPIDSELIQDNLDTYRDWLHARSTCPHCQAIGLQTGRKQYNCLACGAMWSVNEARLCGLKRHLTKIPR